ncbi:zinc finger protein 654 isoform X2 [Ambystoma mexicanum]|uniref:zinc finger protein 654 isoform X2 n=1 Tax=Ambystoma mexicanum TaxID=8296 RepID=UPI0037E95779
MSLFELLLFFGKDEFYEAPLKELIGSVQECNILMRNANLDLRLLTQIMKDGGPWENPVLQTILKGKNESLDLVNNYLSSENQLFFELRVRYLIACERTTEAVALITSCLNHPDVSRNLYYHQAYFTCLHMTPSTEGLLQEHVLRICCSDGIEVICNTEKEGKTALALKLCEAFLLRLLHSGDMYRVWDLIFIWSKLQIKSNSSKEVFVHRCYQLLRTATNIRVIFPFMKTIINEVGEAGIQLAVEICGCALQLDLRDDQYTKALIYKTIAHLMPNDLEICRICVLSVFFLERSMTTYCAVERLYECPDEDYNEHASSVESRVRFELLPILKKGLMFDPEFWNVSMIKQNCAALLEDNSIESHSVVTCPKQQQPLSGDKVSFADGSNGEREHRYVSLSRTRREALAKKKRVVLGTYKGDQSLQRHRCLVCNKEFLGGHIMRHAHSHQKTGCFTCVICGRKFRKRVIMVKHLKNHIKKLKLLKLAVAEHVKTDTKELDVFDTSNSVENGSIDVAKDCSTMKEIETDLTLLSVVNLMEETNTASGTVALNHVSERSTFIENGNLSPCLNRLTEPEPLVVKCLPECKENLNTDTPIPHKINGSLCSPIKLGPIERLKKLRCPAEGCGLFFKALGSLSEHISISHPADLSAQQRLGSLKETYALSKHAKFKCPGSGCIRVFKWLGSLNRHAMIAHPEDLAIQQNICFPKGEDAMDKPLALKCPGQGCARVFKRIGSFYKHMINAHPNELDLQQQLFSPINGDAVEDKPVNIRCLSQGCMRVFKSTLSLNKHTEKVHSDKFDLQQQDMPPSESGTDTKLASFQCPSQGCNRVFRRRASLYKHAQNAHPNNLDLQQQMESLSKSSVIYNPGSFRCPIEGCVRLFKSIVCLHKHTKNAHSNLDPQLLLPSINENETVDKPCNFSCPGHGCIRAFNTMSSLNKHARIAHPEDFKVKQHIMAFNKGKCRFCHRKFLNVQHFFDHLKKHVYPHFHFCLHVNCDQKFKFASELLEHSSCHSTFQAMCSYPGCCQLFDERSRLYHHEAQHYPTNPPETCADVSGGAPLKSFSKPSSIVLEPQLHHNVPPPSVHLNTNNSASLCLSQDQTFLMQQNDRVDLPPPAWKTKDSSEPKTYTQTFEKKPIMVVQNRSENASASVASLVEQMTTVLQPLSESCSVSREHLYNGHVEPEKTVLIPLDASPVNETVAPSPERGLVLQTDTEGKDNISPLAAAPVKQKLQHSTPYCSTVGPSYIRPLASAYLDEIHLSMPKRRKVLSGNSNTPSVIDPVIKEVSERLRCRNCLATYCNADALQEHLAQKCQSLFGFDSDEESAW